MLRAFEAVGRLYGIRRAAQALGLDHAVVSRHIRALEEWAGVRLVGRTNGNIGLTVDGARYHLRISAALLDIASATAELVGRTHEQSLRIWCVPGFASQWLSWRLPVFQAANPDLELELHPTDRSPDFDSYEADMDIRYVAGSEPISGSIVTGGVRRFEIARPSVLAVANPGCAAALQPVLHAADLLKSPLLHEESDHQWIAWFAAHGVDCKGALRGPRMWHAHVAIEAARRGQGVALANHFLLGDDLATGQLVQLFPAALPGPASALGAYVFAARADRWQSSGVTRFRRWLKTMIGATPLAHNRRPVPVTR